MNNIEAVKKILDKPVTCMTDDAKYEVARQICQLFPQPKNVTDYVYSGKETDECLEEHLNRLLTEEELNKLAEEYPCLDFSFEDDYRAEVIIMREAQDAKTASIIRQECQQRVERKKREIEDTFHYETYADSFGAVNYFRLQGLIEKWQAFWKEKGIE